MVFCKKNISFSGEMNGQHLKVIQSRPSVEESNNKCGEREKQKN